MLEIPVEAREIGVRSSSLLSAEIHCRNGVCEVARERVFTRELVTDLQRALGQAEQALSFPHPQWSLSHSKGFCWAVHAADGHGVGFDVEKIRSLDPQALRFFVTDQERSRLPQLQSLSDFPVQFWAVKEALFKADLDNSGRRLRQYEVIRWPKADKKGLAISLVDSKTFSFVSFVEQGWALAVALRNGDAGSEL